ncbi:MAG: hypothetical protein AAF604_06935 [Acidobacteriota bacterium]
MKKITVLLAFLLLSSVGSSLAESKRDGCEPRALDATSSSSLELLARGEIVAVSGANTEHVLKDGKDTKVSTQRFALIDEESNLIGGGTLTCTAECSGAWCATRGCDPVNGSCSPCSCDGDCITHCTCTKEVTVEAMPAPRGPVHPGPLSPRF